MLRKIVISADDESRESYSATGWDANFVKSHLADGESIDEVVDKVRPFAEEHGIEEVTIKL